MKTFHIQARQSWVGFDHDGVYYCLKHLDAHEVCFVGRKDTYNFVVTYGLHCFAKDDQEFSTLTTYSDGVETRCINLERYHLSKFLRGLLEKLDQEQLLYETTKEKFFTFYHVDDLTGVIEKCKVCLCIFKENRLLRIHVSSAFFDRERSGITTNSNGFSIFKVALDTVKKPRNSNIPKEATRK